jgi:hypothetical protein
MHDTCKHAAPTTLLPMLVPAALNSPPPGAPTSNPMRPLLLPVAAAGQKASQARPRPGSRPLPSSGPRVDLLGALCVPGAAPGPGRLGGRGGRARPDESAMPQAPWVQSRCHSHAPLPAPMLSPAPLLTSGPPGALPAACRYIMQPTGQQQPCAQPCWSPTAAGPAPARVPCCGCPTRRPAQSNRHSRPFCRPARCCTAHRHWFLPQRGARPPRTPCGSELSAVSGCCCQAAATGCVHRSRRRPKGQHRPGLPDLGSEDLNLMTPLPTVPKRASGISLKPDTVCPLPPHSLSTPPLLLPALLLATPATAGLPPSCWPGA